MARRDIDADHPPTTLEYAFDERRRPSEVTVFDRERDISTHWLTVDVETAIPAGEWR